LPATTTTLLEKFFDDPESITVDEMRAAIRAAVCDMKMTPGMCGSAFKNKGVQACLDAVCYFLPSPIDIESVKGTDPKTDQEVHAQTFGKASRLRPWHSKLQPTRL
jgi:elongation factor G